MHLASGEDAEVQEAALRGLLELAREKTDQSNGSSKEDDEKLKQILQKRVEEFSLMSPEDLTAAKDERQLVDALWSTRYNEPSSLLEKGLLVLPGEDAPPPDVASQHFQSPLRALAANRNSDTVSSSDKNEPPLLLGPGPSTE